MSEDEDQKPSHKLPTQEEISTLPLTAQAALAARCARRVLLLAPSPSTWATDGEEFEIYRAVVYAEAGIVGDLDRPEAAAEAASYAEAIAQKSKQSQRDFNTLAAQIATTIGRAARASDAAMDGRVACSFYTHETVTLAYSLLQSYGPTHWHVALVEAEERSEFLFNERSGKIDALSDKISEISDTEAYDAEINNIYDFYKIKIDCIDYDMEIFKHHTKLWASSCIRSDWNDLSKASQDPDKLQSLILDWRAGNGLPGRVPSTSTSDTQLVANATTAVQVVTESAPPQLAYVLVAPPRLPKPATNRFRAFRAGIASILNIFRPPRFYTRRSAKLSVAKAWKKTHRTFAPLLEATQPRN